MYFILEEDCSPIIGKDYPQSVIMANIDNENQTNGLEALMRCTNTLPDFVPVLGDVILSGTANLTDVISSINFNTYLGRLVNEKTLNLLTHFSLPINKAYPVNVIYKGCIYKYYWLHIISNEFEFINFKKSLFISTNALGRKIEEFKIDSYDAYVDKRKKLDERHLIEFGKLVIFKDKVNIDLFSVGTGFFKYFASDRLRNSLVKHEITCIALLPLPRWIYFE